MMSMTTSPAFRIAAAALVGVVAVRTVAARWAGLNPESLWYDDVVWAAVAWAPDVWTTLSVPAHAPPLFFLLLRVARGVFRDPEWSMQLLPFVCSIAAIPVMAAVAWRLTRSAGLSVLAAGLTALNPLLAHYSLFVKQYAVDFLVTASLLAGGIAVLRNDVIDLRAFTRLAVGAGLVIGLSMTSVFTSAPIVALGTWRGWRERRDRSAVAVASVAYWVLLLTSFLAFRGRTNEALRGQRVFASRFMPADSLADAWGFLTTSGRRVLETSLPSWLETDLLQPAPVSWTLPFLALGLAWLLSRRSTRAIGLAVAGFYASVVLASALRVYPLGAGRTDIFAFPVGIALFVAGVHAATAGLPAREAFRGALALIVAAIALAAPIRATYFPVNDVPLVHRVAAEAAPEDAVVLSPHGTHFAAYYGPWPVVIEPSAEHTSGTRALILRPRTLHLPPEDRRPAPFIREFLAGEPPDRVWYLAFRTPAENRAVDAIASSGYALRQVQSTNRGRVYLGTRSP
jgi:hypothetical protein